MLGLFWFNALPASPSADGIVTICYIMLAALLWRVWRSDGHRVREFMVPIGTTGLFFAVRAMASLFVTCAAMWGWTDASTLAHLVKSISTASILTLTAIAIVYVPLVHPWLTQLDRVREWQEHEDSIEDERRIFAIMAERDAMLQRLADSIPNLIWMLNATGRCTYVNRRWTTYTGLTAEATIPRTWFDLMQIDDRDRVLTHWTTAFSTHTPFEVEARMRCARTGEYRWFLHRAVPLTDAQGVVTQWFGTSTDVHESKMAAEHLARLQTIQRNRYVPTVQSTVAERSMPSTGADGLRDSIAATVQ